MVQLGARADPNHQLELSRAATTRSSDAYHDPTSGDARWLAGFAPVGATGYVVIVQTRIEDAVAPSRTVARGLALGFAVPLIAVVLVALIAGRRRAR